MVETQRRSTNWQHAPTSKQPNLVCPNQKRCTFKSHLRHLLAGHPFSDDQPTNCRPQYGYAVSRMHVGSLGPMELPIASLGTSPVDRKRVNQQALFDNSAKDWICLHSEYDMVVVGANRRSWAVGIVNWMPKTAQMH